MELESAPPDEFRRLIVAMILDDQPLLVLTFDPKGFNVHPDLVAISRFTADAVTAAADDRWYPERGPAHVVPELLWSTQLEPWQEVSTNVKTHAGVDIVLDVSRWWRTKAAALRAPRTQHLSIEPHFFSKPNLEQILGGETWRRAWPRDGAAGQIPF
jgi:LmbE family N-acetylglucosaminyl deacetylase